ncbi:M23 family metallopeptidase [Portibacter lacus]|uniref:LysM domain-containing protein n=1 Tax=Portibacter lacus TaxID=1099794 RepID=A0AA37SPF9_9BACT|nr:M23 family metallopeptidase [Portibacter lacus]GLR16431.1 hypothetical protein GCM10007940_10460 [Portibacter lacus]
MLITHAYAQEEVTPLVDTLTYEKIMLDGSAAYLISETKEIITAREYDILQKKNNPQYIEPLYTDYWDTLEVNPFKSVKVEKPFLLQFDDLKYSPPVNGNMVVTSRFGRRRRGPHRGIDIDLVVGDTVRTIFSGQVRFVGYSRGHGKTVIVRHENDIETVYAHLSEYGVKTNDFVDKGQYIGLGGATGNARGSHLHMEIRHKGICINPDYLMDFVEPKVYADSLWVTKGLTDPYSHSSYSKGDYEILKTKELADGYDKRAQKIYVVRSGDTLWGIARKNGMRVSDIVRMNNRKVSAKSTLRIGQHLIISP